MNHAPRLSVREHQGDARHIGARRYDPPPHVFIGEPGMLIAVDAVMVGMRKELIHVEPDDHASTGELIGRLTKETAALVKAEVARIKHRASSIVAPAASLAVVALIGIGTFALGLLAFGVASFSGIHALTGSVLISGLVVGAVAWVCAAIAGAICAGVARAILNELKRG